MKVDIVKVVGQDNDQKPSLIKNCDLHKITTTASISFAAIDSLSWQLTDNNVIAWLPNELTDL